MKKKLLAILLTVCMVLSMAPAALAADSVFTDVKADDWFADEVKYVYDNGLMNGVGDNAFDPSGTVTRAMVWTTLARLDGVNTAGSDPWWLAGQQWAMENEISDGTMAENNITREQLVTMIWRYAKYIDMDVSEGEDTNILSYTDALDVNEWAISAMQWACAVGIINGIDGALQPQGDASRAMLAAILYRFVEEVMPGEEAPKPSTPVVPNYPSIPVHFHSYTVSYTSNNDGTHVAACACGATNTEDCEYGDDTVCDKCTYDKGAVAVIGTSYYATLAEAIATVTDATPVEIVVLKTEETATVANIEIPGGSNITLRGVTGTASDVKVSGQIATLSSTEGSLTIKDLTILVDGDIVDSTGISQTSKSAIALWGNQTVTCENVTFDMSLADSSAISGWWDTGIGTTINVKNCVFNCNGQRPIRTCGNVSVEGCTFNDPYRYAIQLTGKAGTATELENAVINFKNNTIVNGANGKNFVYGIQLEGETYGCNDLVINGSGNNINAGEWDTNNESAMYYCECGKVEHATVAWNTEVPAVHEDSNFTPVAMIGGVEYSAFADAIDAVQNNETIVILPGTYTEVIDVTGGKTFTVKAEEAGTVVIAGIDQQTNGDKASTVTFKNLTIDNSKATEGWFIGTAQNIFPCVGAWGGNLSFENCTFEVAGTSKKETGVMTWWTTNKVTLSFNECTFNGIGNHESARAMQIYGNVDLTVTGCEFNTKKDYSLKYVGNEGCTATLSGNKVYNSENFVELGSSTYPGSKYTVYLNDNTLGENVSNFVIANPENQIVYVNGARAIISADELATALSADAEKIDVVLYKDIEVPVASLSQYGQTPGSGEYKLGGDNTTAITIDLNGHKLTLTTSYMTAIGAKNDNATITIKNGSMNGTGNSATTWNINDLIFANCNYVFEDVTFDKEVALCNTGKTVTMTDVTIKGTGDYYALWIQAEGQTVKIEGLTVETTGRGIKIDEQYSNENVAKVTLTLAEAKFTTAKKAAVMVKSAAGADIIVNSIDITGVTADTTNAVWVDEDAAAHADKVTVTGATMIVEN